MTGEWGWPRAGTRGADLVVGLTINSHSMQRFAFSLLLFTYVLLNLIQRLNFERKPLHTHTRTHMHTHAPPEVSFSVARCMNVYPRDPHSPSPPAPSGLRRLRAVFKSALPYQQFRKFHRFVHFFLFAIRFVLFSRRWLLVTTNCFFGFVFFLPN